VYRLAVSVYQTLALILQARRTPPLALRPAPRVPVHSPRSSTVLLVPYISRQSLRVLRRFGYTSGRSLGGHVGLYSLALAHVLLYIAPLGLLL
jgi:hypothetical protein